MNMVMPTDNAYDIPALRLDRQGKVTSPVVAWGTVARGTPVPGGTVVFYVDDYRFGSLAKDPLQLAQVACTNAAELNLSVYEQTPRAEVIWATYRKRYAARLWQDAGMGVLVDLNVPARHRELCMAGVPPGWKAFATRGYAARPDALRDECAFARVWGGPGTTVLVYGGGRATETLCWSIPEAIWVPAHRDEVNAHVQR
jgi:hypothetical protein